MRHSRTWWRSLEHRNSLGRRGFTLVEMMIALVITLMIVFAMVEAFRWVGEATTDGRASIEMLGQIRHARFRLEDDLSRCTASLTPWGANAGLSQGYFELVEGSGSDNRLNPDDSTVRLPLRFIDRTDADDNDGVPAGYDVAVFSDPNNALAFEHGTLFGDVDDVVMFTARNDDVPFRGRYGGVVIESNLAEIVWWAELNDVTQDINGDGLIATGEGANGEWDPGETFTIRRRVLLIRPDLNNTAGIVTSINMANPPNATEAEIRQTFNNFLQLNDISVHLHFDLSNRPTALAANSLGDLTYRHNRVAHRWLNYGVTDGATTPTARGLSAHQFNSASTQAMSPLDVTRLPVFTDPNLIGEDVVLTNVLAFDFRVWDPVVSVTNFQEDSSIGTEALLPGDPGYADSDTQGIAVGQGGFIDLGVSGSAGHFTGGMQAKSYLNTGEANSYYDPWTINYESDGFNQDGDTGGGVSIVDEGTNGIDDDNQYGPDDVGQVGTTSYPGERETSPPYPHPLKSIQVRIRMYEPDTRQVRQASQVVKFRTE